MSQITRFEELRVTCPRFSSEHVRVRAVKSEPNKSAFCKMKPRRKPRFSPVQKLDTCWRKVSPVVTPMSLLRFERDVAFPLQFVTFDDPH